MLTEFRRSLRVGLIAGAGIALAISVHQRNWPAAVANVFVIYLAFELIGLQRRLARAPFDRCTHCGRHRIGGGVFVAGVGPICFECEERKFGSDLLEGADDGR